MITGFARNTIIGVVDKIIDAIKEGAIKHFFLVGGCDGAKPGRNYYTKFVEKNTKRYDSLNACLWKIPFNDMDFSQI